MIHPTAIVARGARLATDVEVGPYSIIGEHVEVGEGTRIGAHIVIDGQRASAATTASATSPRSARRRRTRSTRASPPRSRSATATPSASTSPSTAAPRRTPGSRASATTTGSWPTCTSRTTARSAATPSSPTSRQLAGHVTSATGRSSAAPRWCTSSCKIGAHVFTGMGTYLPQDLPPYVTAAGNMAQPYGINTEGLKRRGFSPEAIAGLKRAYKTLYRKGLAPRRRDAASSRRRQARMRRSPADRGLPRALHARHHPRSRPWADLLRVAMVAGEASGDLLGAPLIAALKARRNADRVRRHRRAAHGGARLRVALPDGEALGARLRRGAQALPRDHGDPAQPHAKSLLAERPDALHRRRRARLQPRPRAQAQGRRHPGHPLRQPVDLGLARLAHPPDRALGDAHAGDVPVRGGDLREGGRPGHLRRPSARRPDPAGAEQARGARRAAPAGEQADRRAAARQPALRARVHGRARSCSPRTASARKCPRCTSSARSRRARRATCSSARCTRASAPTCRSRCSSATRTRRSPPPTSRWWRAAPRRWRRRFSRRRW